MPKEILKTAKSLHKIISSVATWAFRSKVNNVPQAKPFSIAYLCQVVSENYPKFVTVVAATLYAPIAGVYGIKSKIFNLSFVRASYLYIFDSDFLPLCSFVLIVGSLVCLALALRDVSTSVHPDVTDKLSDSSASLSELDCTSSSLLTPPRTPPRNRTIGYNASVSPLRSNSTSPKLSPRLATPQLSPRFFENQQDVLRNFNAAKVRALHLVLSSLTCHYSHFFLLTN